MKFFYLISILFITTSLFAQNTYTFDCLIEYECKRTEEDKAETVYLLTNSQDSSYSVLIRSLNEATFNFYFRDVNLFTSMSVVNKRGFLKAETVELSCESVILQKDKVDLERYDFMINTDTLIGDQKYKRYSMQYRKARDSKKYKKGKSYYIVENGTEFHNPLIVFSSVFDVTVTSEIFPNGIAKEMYNTSKFGVKSHYKLVNYVKVNKTIVIPDCAKLNP